jgi:hypothetical protein
MTRIEATAASPDLTRPGMETPAAPISKWGPWAWTAIACLTLGGSGVVRAVQERRHEDERNYRESCPISLASIPAKLGGWKLVAGGEKTLDDLTVRITGGTDYILRNYVDDLTGVSLVALVLFGPAEPVLPHTPEVCYPATGYSLVDDASDRLLKSDDGTSMEFRSLVYSKPGGRSALREEVYYSFRLEGRWSPDAGAGRKFPRRNPSVFKVQVQRRVAEGEHRDLDEPIEDFLKILIPEIERRIAAAEKSTGPAKTSAGGPGSAPVDGKLRPDQVAALAVRPEEGPSGEPRRAPGQDRGHPDQADEQDHRQQVEDERDLDRQPERVDPPGPGRLGDGLLAGTVGIGRNGDHQPCSSSSNDPERRPVGDRGPRPGLSAAGWPGRSLDVDDVRHFPTREDRHPPLYSGKSRPPMVTPGLAPAGANPAFALRC